MTRVMSKLMRHRAGDAPGAVAELSGNRIVTARPERMTSKNSSHGEPASADGSMLLERFDRVRRAARHVPAARRQHRRKRNLVSADQQDEERAHESIYCDELRRDARSLMLDRGRDPGELVEGQTVRGRTGMNDHVHRGHPWQENRPRKLSQPALQPIPVDGGLAVFRHDEPNPRMSEMQKGSAHPNIEMFGAKSLPCSRDLTQLGATCDAMTARKRGGRTRLMMRDRYARPRLRARVLARELHGQPLPALLATPREYLTAPLVGHAKAESVSLDAALVARAVGWLAHSKCLR